MSTILHPHSVPLGELPPQPPRACFGRDLVIEEIVSLAKNFKPVALIGAGGIGKTSIALTVLHDDRIKNVFGDNRRFIRCDKFPASRAHFLARLSKVIGAGVENPEDLTPLQSALSSRGMILFLDNAESILDPQGEEAREIYAIVEELSRFRNICLGITSRLSTVPPCCKRVVIPTLSTEAACDIFYNTYDRAERSGIIEDLVQRLDFHALSITLLATTASHNVWDHTRLAKEWETHRARALRTDYNESLAATIELSLASPTFRKLCPEARELLGVAAFFPQGIDENNLDWLFPAISDRRGTFDKFFALSLTSRTDGFITMLGPIRDYLCPLDPKSSQLLCATKDRYFSRLSVSIDPDDPGFEESRWIVSEDVNVEHLLRAFSSIDANSDDVWNTCGDFMEHLYWHKPRQTVLRTKIEDLPDDHRSKPRCLFQLSRLFESTGNNTERKRVLTRALKLERERGDNIWIAYTLEHLAETNRLLGLNEEGILQAKEALEISERLGSKRDQADCLDTLTRLFYYDHQLDAAEETATRTIDFLSGDGEEFRVCKSHRLLGKIYDAKGEKEKAIHHFETALEIASTPNWQDQLFWIRYSLAKLFRDEDQFDEAQVHTDRAKSHATDDPYNLGCATGLHASIWYRQGRLEEAKSEALRAIEIFEKLGTSKDSMGGCKDLLGKIERATEDGLPLSS